MAVLRDNPFPPLLDQLRETIREFRMISPGDRVAVACSGGADSTALLLLLHEMADSLGCVLSVAHLNHCLRGIETDADEQFVRNLAQRLGLECHVERADVGSLARLSKMNQEATGRELRLRFFYSLVKNEKAQRVALAHTADDQAETVLYRLLRGAGTRGLVGIHPMVKGKIIRPLIAARRAALREWLIDRNDGRNEKWREDASNQDFRFARNRIRGQVLPLLAEFNPRIVETLAHTAAIARQEEEFWETYLEPVRENLVRWEPDKAILDIEKLREQPPAVAYRLLRWLAARISNSGFPNSAGQQSRTLDFLHVQRLLRWALEAQSGKVLTLPDSLEARKEFSHLILVRGESPAEDATAPGPAGYTYPIRVPSTIEVPEARATFRFEFITLGTRQPRYNEGGTILLDIRLAGSPLSLRNWRAGDAYQQQGHRSSKKLQDLFQRKRIPFRERAGWPVLLAGERIIWVRGLAVAEGCSPSRGSAEAIGIRETGAK